MQKKQLIFTASTSIILILVGIYTAGTKPASTSISDYDTRNYYNKHRSFFYRKPQYRLHHILVKSSEELKNLLLSYNKTLAETNNPQKAMITLADNFSKKNSSSNTWGDLGWVSKNKFPKKFSEKAFSIKKPGEYITFSSPLGHHLVMLMHIREPKHYILSEVKNYIKTRLEYDNKNIFFQKPLKGLEKDSPKKEIAKMVFIKGGEFYAGFGKDEIKERYEVWHRYVAPYVNQDKPGWTSYINQTYHKADVKPFYIDKHEVSYGEYKAFLDATGHRPLPDKIVKFIPGDDYPVVGVSWYDADAYCKWKGKRLLTQDEWEFVARGKVRRKYPWGNELPDGERGNFADINSDVPWKNISYDDGYKYLAPVKSYPEGTTPEGVYNLGGNTKEWTSTIDKEKQTAIAKGGSFKNAFDDMLSADQRSHKLDSIDRTIGFRCAGDIESYPKKLPPDFIKSTSAICKIPSEFSLSAGGGIHKKKADPLKHYPIIMIPANKRSFNDWLDKNTGNAKGKTGVYNKFICAGFLPEELWLYQYTQKNKEMRNIEELTDGLKWLIYSVLWYTRSSKVQILAHGEGAVLAQAAIKKYNLYNLINAVVYIAGPFHGSSRYTYEKALAGSPVSSNLVIGSDFLQDINLPDETPYNISEKENTSNVGIKYMTIYNGLPYKDSYFPTNLHSPSLLGAHNYQLSSLNYDGLRCSEKSSELFIPFFSDETIKYNILYDNDPSIFPGAPETPEDNIDQDCNGMDLLNKTGKDRLVPVKRKK